MIPEEVNKIVLYPKDNFNAINILGLIKLANISLDQIKGMVNIHLIENCFYNIYCTNDYKIFHNKNYRSKFEIKKESLQDNENLSYNLSILKGFSIKVNTFIYIKKINFTNLVFFIITFWIIFTLSDKILFFFFYIANKNNDSVLNLIYNEVNYEDNENSENYSFYDEEYSNNEEDYIERNN